MFNHPAETLPPKHCSAAVFGVAGLARDHRSAPGARGRTAEHISPIYTIEPMQPESELGFTSSRECFAHWRWLLSRRKAGCSSGLPRPSTLAARGACQAACNALARSATLAARFACLKSLAALPPRTSTKAGPDGTLGSARQSAATAVLRPGRPHPFANSSFPSEMRPRQHRPDRP